MTKHLPHWCVGHTKHICHMNQLLIHEIIYTGQEGKLTPKKKSTEHGGPHVTLMDLSMAKSALKAVDFLPIRSDSIRSVISWYHLYIYIYILKSIIFNLQN